MALTKASWKPEQTRAVLEDAIPRSEPTAAAWRVLEELTTAPPLVTIGESLFRLLALESVGSGFVTGLLGAHYEKDCLQRSWPKPLQSLVKAERTLGRYYLLALRTNQTEQPVYPLATLLEDHLGDFHVVETRFVDAPGFWTLFSMGAHLLVESARDPARFDDFGDFQVLGAPSVVHRHSTERLSKHIAQRVLHDPRLCNHCMRCVTACSEMRALVSDQGARLLGPSEDYCTSCGLCQKRCALLQAQPKEGLDQTRQPRWPLHEGGRGVHLYGQVAIGFHKAMEFLGDADPPWFPYVFRASMSVPDAKRDSYPVDHQWELSLRGASASVGARPLVVTSSNGHDPDVLTVVVRSRCRTAVVLQTETGLIERDLTHAAMRLGMSVSAVLDWEFQGESNSLLAGNEAGRMLFEIGHFRQDALEALWESNAVDLFVAPYAQRLPLRLQQRILEDTGRQVQVIAPHIRQALPVTQSPLLTKLNDSLLGIFEKYPELLETEAKLARELLQDIPRNHALLHARYRTMAVASGHTACPTCAEVQVLAIPTYMAIAMSLARGEIPHVALTMETGCMSETLNKANEVAQKVPGGRTVFGGGFAFGEAMTMAQDRSIRLGHLPKSRRYVVSQGGDGGAVIGLPAWLNALRQQASLIRQRHPNVLHFINITDTQVYSNTGGESSASSLLGMGTLTTPIGKFLMGNQNVQWTLINLAAEFPGVLVGSGHSANRVAIQQFWHLADQLGQSGIRWDVTPCPETGKFFGEDPDDLAEVMAHAGMLPEVVFVGRMRKRVGPYHPDDRGKPFDQWRLIPKPVLYWLERDPRYRALLKRNLATGVVEPRNLVASFLITQLESLRDQMNGQIDLETRLVLKTEQQVTGFLDAIKTEWWSYRFDLDRFRYPILFDSDGEWKPHLRVSLQHEMVRRALGWDELQRYTVARDQVLNDQQSQLAAYLGAIGDLEKASGTLEKALEAQSDAVREALGKVQHLQDELQKEARKLQKCHAALFQQDPVEEEIFRPRVDDSLGTGEWQRRRLEELLERILAERALAQYTELQQYRLAQELKEHFIQTGGVIRAQHLVAGVQGRASLRARIAEIGPFAIGVASLAGDRGIAINRAFANFFTAKGAWAGMAWQFGSSKRGTPVLSATFVDSKPLQRKDAMHSFPMAVLTVTNFEEMKRQPDLFFGQLQPTGFLIVNQRKDANTVWRELVEHYPADIRQLALELRAEYGKQQPGSPEAGPVSTTSDHLEAGRHSDLTTVHAVMAQRLWGQPASRLNPDQQRLVDKVTTMVCARVVSIDMDGIMREVSGSSAVVSNLVAIGPMFQALQAMGFDFDWARDLPTLSQGFPDAVLKNAKLLNQYYQAMELARERSGLGPLEAPSCELQASSGRLQAASDVAQDMSLRTQEAGELVEDPGEYLMIMGGTLAGMVLSQVALPDHPLFYVGFPITPAGNPFYAMAEAYANGHPYVVVDEVNPSEKVAAEKLIGIARVGGFLPVTFTASQGWRLFTEIFPQFVGARLEGLFLITKRALAAPNLNIEESHTDFMSFRDDGGIMLAPKGIQEYVATLYLARLLTHFAKLPVIVSIGGITDTHKIGLVKVPTDERVRSWLEKTLAGFDFLEHKIINRQGDVLVHGPSGTSAVYQETQSEIEKAHMAAMRVYRYGLQAVYELTGDWIGELEVQCQGDAPRGHREQSVMVRGQPKEARAAAPETLFVLQGSLFPNAGEALRSLEREGWTGMGCLSVRCFNPFPEEPLAFWLNQSRRVVVLDRSNSFGSIPPLASRIFTTCARCCKMDGDSKLPILRTLVGGLGGREITVDEMKDILLSTHLLFRSGQPWEESLVAQWLDEDEVLRALLAEAAALDWRSVQRHTRIPDHLRSFAAEQEEYRNYLERLKLLLIRRDYPAFLANYHQVEFVAPREVLQETTLLQQIVVRLEVRLARQALASGRGDWRHALVLLHYGREGRDQEAVVAALRDGIEKGRIKSGLLEHYGMAGVRMGDAPHGESPRQPIEENVAAPMEGAETSASADLAAGEGGYRVSFDAAEANRIESIIQELVQVQSDRAWFFNPEDYEHELLTRLQATPASPLFAVRERHAAVTADQILRSYRQCYRDVFHRSLQWEVLTQHHVPELKGLFAGDGLCRLQALADKFATVLADDSKEHLSDTVQAELERHLTERCIPHLRHSPIVYLEYFRTWVAPELIGKALAPKETSQLS